MSVLVEVPQNLKVAVKWLCMADALALGLKVPKHTNWSVGRCDGQCGERTLVAFSDKFSGAL